MHTPTHCENFSDAPTVPGVPGSPMVQPGSGLRHASGSGQSCWLHGGPDALGAPRFDFSTNCNACGPCPSALAAVHAADATRYPDPAYTALRHRLATFHQVSASRIVLAASASEAIFRLSAWASQQGVRTVHWPAHHYGDYTRAAHAWGLQASADASGALCWACEPSSPLGQAHSDWPRWLTLNAADCSAKLLRLDVADTEVQRLTTDTAGCAARLLVLDSVYAPLRLSGTPTLTQAQLGRVWQLFSPNKALGITGVRAAYLIAPDAYFERAGGQFDPSLQQLVDLAPSWPLGAHGVALLHAWTQADTQAWLTDSLPTLRHWKARQIALLQARGWTVQPSDANFFCAQPPQPLDATQLRQRHSIKLRDATSFGLPGWYRLGVLEPGAQDALDAALAQVGI